MPTNERYKGLIIGAAFTVCCLFLTLNTFIPILSSLPGWAFETLASLITSKSYKNTGKLTIFLLAATLVIILTLYSISIRRQVLKGHPVTKSEIIFIMALCYFIVHPLGMYMYWGIELGFRSDGQLIFLMEDSFPISSFAFIPIGIIIDIVKNKYKKLSASMLSNTYD